MSGLYNYRWQQLRLHFLRAHPLCVMCERRGRLVAASVVDHVVPHKGNPVLFWDATNWQGLCASCHNSRKQMLEQPGKVQPHASWTGGWNRGGGSETEASELERTRPFVLNFRNE